MSAELIMMTGLLPVIWHLMILKTC